MRPEYVIGLDLGQSVDHTAVCVAEVLRVPSGEREGVPGVVGQSRDGRVIPIMREKLVKQLNVRHLARLELGMSYVAQVDTVAALLSREPLKSANVTLVVDRGGVGRPISDMLEEADLPCEIAMVTLHGGDVESRDGMSWSTPKRDVVAACSRMLQQGLLRVAAGLPLAETLARELSEYEVRISQFGRDSYSAPSGAHDDLVVALALTTWWVTDSGTTEFYALGSFFS